MSMILFVLDDPEKLPDVLAAWEQCGVPGMTVWYSTGLGRLREKEGLRDDIPLIPSLSDFFSQPEHYGRTIFSILDDDSLIPVVIEATEQIVGDLDQPGAGILAVLPVSQVRGLAKRKTAAG
ncbi:MAG: hypothetical protein Fur0016_00760 [Anaerolineales bacterium]